MTTTAAVTDTDNYVRVLVFPDGIDSSDIRMIPTRPYDFNRGDRRFYDQGRAIEHANSTALETGVRQVVRVTSPALDRGAPLYLVQAVGS